LQGHGAKASQLAEVEARGELFGGVAEAEARSAQRRMDEQATKEAKAAEVAAKAESAQSAMGDAMNALVLRGEKINELGDKASELNEGAKDFGDMAKQLKETMKNRKWYQF
jgi:syntaxin-binding protein 5